MALAALFACAATAPAARADATIVVNSTVDPGSGTCTPSGGVCTLREALELVEEGEVSGDVDIALDVEGTIDVGAAGELEVDPALGVGELSILGPGASLLTIDGGGESRVFRVEGAESVRIAGVTIAHGLVTAFALDGDGGAGIYAKFATLDLQAVRLTQNVIESGRAGGAIAIEEGATLTLVGSRVDHNRSADDSGGGIAARAGELNVIESTIEENHADELGGGIYSKATTTIERSTIAANSVPDDEGAPEAGEEGGGGIARGGGGPMLLRASTVSENSGGGVYNESGPLVIRNSTIAGNLSDGLEGAGIEGEEFVLQSTIVAGNLRDGVEADCAGSVESEGANLVGTPSEAPGCDWDGAAGDLFGADPALGALANNGGPTETMAPVSRESAAINKGDNPQPTDQRGSPRPVPDGVANTDVGAVEVQASFNRPGEAPAITPAADLEVGETLTCTPGGWATDTVTDPSFAYAWFAGSEPIGTGATHVLVNSDAGKQLTCAVTVDNGVASASASSAAVELEPGVAVLAPTALGFGSRRVGSGPSEPQTLTVTNQGGADLDVSAVATSNPEFPVDGDECTAAALGPGESCEIEARFDPAAAGLQSSFVSVESDGGNPVATVSGTATEPSFSVAPASFDFGSQKVGTDSGGQSFVVTNLGGAPMSIGQVALGGANPADFEVDSDGCSNTVVSAAGECTVTVSFAPTATGARGATLSFPGEAPGSVGLEGTGIAPAVTIEPTALDFGSHPVGSISAAQPFLVTNSGSAPLTIGTVALAGVDPAQFQLGPTNTCTNATLAAGAQCSVDVSFAPTALGAKAATLQVPGNASGSAPLQGTGIAASFSATPTSLDFGSREVGSGPSAEQTVTVENIGDGPMTIESASVSAAGAGAFVLPPAADECSATVLQPDDTCTVAVAFEPSADGLVDAALQFAGNAPGSVALKGTGIEARLSVAPGGLDFGNEVVGGSGQPIRFVAENVGSGPMNIAAVAIAGLAASSFRLVADGCASRSLAPGQQCALEVAFAPQALGPLSGQIVFAGNAPGAVELFGTGQPVPVPAPSPGPEPSPAAPYLTLKAPKAPARVGSSGLLKLRIACESPTGAVCKGDLTLLGTKDLSGWSLARWAGKVAAGKTKQVSLRLTRKGRDALASGRLTVIALAATSAGERRTKLVLAPPRRRR